MPGIGLGVGVGLNNNTLIPTINSIFNKYSFFNLWASENVLVDGTETTWIDYGNEHDLVNPTAGEQPIKTVSDSDFNSYPSFDFSTSDRAAKNVSNYRGDDESGVITICFDSKTSGNNKMFTIGDKAGTNIFLDVRVLNLKPRLLVFNGTANIQIEVENLLLEDTKNTISFYSTGSALGAVLNETPVNTSILTGSDAGQWLADFASQLDNINIAALDITSGTTYGNVELGLIGYSSFIDIASIQELQKDIKLHYNLTYGVENVFDNGFFNSVVYENEVGYNKRSSASEWKFNYSGTYLYLKFKYISNSIVNVLVDGVIEHTTTITDESLVSFVLPAGEKVVQIIEGSLGIDGIGNLIGSWLTDVWLEPNKYSKINQSAIAYKIGVIGDSITQGGGTGNGSILGFPKRYTYDNGIDVGLMGYGGGKLFDMAGDSTKLNNTLSIIGDCFSNVTTTKKLIIALCINDFISGKTVGNITTWYTNLVDGIITNYPDIDIYCLEPIIYSGDDATLDAIRLAIRTICSTRSATSMDGKSALVLGDLSDGLHPHATGAQKLKDFIYTNYIS